MNRRTGTVPTLALLFLGLALAAPLARAGGLEPFLDRFADADRSKGPELAAPLFAWDRAEADRSRVRVLIDRQPGVDREELRAAVEAAARSVSWEGGAGRFVQVVLDRADLRPVAALPEVFYVLRPPRGLPSATTSEGLEGMEVPSFQALGYRGEDVRIAVLDLGFDGYEALLGTELPDEVRVRSFYHVANDEVDITGKGEPHGTACAEIVHDIAPGAQLYLVNAQTAVELLDAVEWLIEEKVSIINHSVGWFFGGLDGTGPINDVADRAAREGILWVNAAGNEAERHTWADASDLDGDDLLELESGDERLDFQEVSRGQTLAIALLWDQWPVSTSLDFVLEFVNGEEETVASSEDDFAGYPYAFRYLEWTSPDGRDVAVQVRRKRGTIEGRTIHLFRIGSGVKMEEHAREDRSLLSPADSRSVLAVGATDWQTNELEPYSSRGSFDGEPVKPEICGPVGVTTTTYGRRGFRGTSVAAPHVSGAAALIASAALHGAYYDILWTREDLEQLLRMHARPATEIAPLAWGIVRVPSEQAAEPGIAPLLLGNPARGIVRWSAPCGRVEILDASGRLVGRAGPSGWDGRGRDGRLVPAGVYWIRCPGGGGASRLSWLGR